MSKERSAKGSAESTTPATTLACRDRTRALPIYLLGDREGLRAAAERAGIEPDRVDPWAAGPGRLAEARSRLAADWAEARRDSAVFGVPTLRFDGERPWYLRLERTPQADEGEELLDWLVAIRAAAPYLLELKVPEPTPG